MTSTPLLSIEELSKKYTSSSGKEILALNRVNLTINEGEFISLIGPSGCGKSTLLRLMSGLDRDFSGKLSWSSQSSQKNDIGFVFQEATLLPWRNVLSNICLGIETIMKDKKAREQQGRKLLDLVGLSDFADAYPAELSGGMQQRVAIARALVPNPKILLMDEPFGALDAITREGLQEDLLRLRRETKKTIVMVTHSVEEAAFLSHRVVILSSRPGTVKEIVSVSFADSDSSNIRQTPEFSRVSNHLWSGLKS